MITNRTSIISKFMNLDVPNENDFQEIFESFVHKEEDKANFAMVEAGIDDAHYVTPSLLRTGLQNIGIITGNCYKPFKEYFEGLASNTLTLQKLPVKDSVEVFKNGQLLREGEGFDYTVNYTTAAVTLSAVPTSRNIEVNYWYKNSDGDTDTPGNTSALIIVTEEGNRGYRLSTSDPVNFGNIGADAVDFSYSDTPSDGFGATGESSFAMGYNVIASNYNSVAFGSLIDNDGIGSFDSGINLKDSGYTNSLFGTGHDVTSINTTVVGQAANIITDQILDYNATADKKLFVVGNGTIQNADEDYTVLTRSDALVVRQNGSVEAPSLSNAEINADTTGKVLVTKEWVESQITASTDPRSYKVYTATLVIHGGTCEVVRVFENTIGVIPSFSLGSNTTTIVFSGITGYNYWGQYTVSNDPSNGDSTRITGKENTFRIYDKDGASMNWSPTGGARYISLEIRIYPWEE